jgi:RimJ/RimL family protein N-acetyltransferase
MTTALPQRPELGLVLLGEQHLASLQAMLADEQILRFSKVPVPVPDGFERAWLQSYQGGRVDGTREAFAIAGECDEFLGIALAPDINSSTRTVELGYLVAPEARGQGVATAALNQLTDWALSVLGALRIELYISVDNAASKRVAQRCGYVREGVLRSRHFKQDLREDTEIWSRLPGN